MLSIDPGDGILKTVQFIGHCHLGWYFTWLAGTQLRLEGSSCFYGYLSVCALCFKTVNACAQYPASGKSQEKGIASHHWDLTVCQGGNSVYCTYIISHSTR